MIFRELLLKFPWSDIKERLVELYPDQENNLDLYEQVYDELLSLDVQKEMKEIHIIIELVKDDDSEYYSTEGIVEGESIGYSLQFLRWEKWLGLPIYNQTLQKTPHLDIVVHCLWEMTFSGFTQDDIYNTRMGMEQEDNDQDFITIDISDELKIDVSSSLNEEDRAKIVDFFEDMMKEKEKNTQE